MPNETEIFKMDDQYAILLRKWLPDEPKGIILLSHGMTEHSQRYEGFGNFLKENGIGLYCHDQRAHGNRAVAEKSLGHLVPKKGWDEMTNDLVEISGFIKERFSCPLFLMGHSMGSFLARWVIQTRSIDYAGLIISGTGGSPGFMGQGGLALAKISCALFGAEKPAPGLQKMNFGTFNRHFKPNKTAFDWLCSDPAQVEIYQADPLCGFTCSNGFFYELYDHVLRVNRPESDQNISANLPIYLLSGDQDPVGDMGKGVQAVYQHYLAAGVLDISLKLYPGCRHELLNEPNQLQVANDLLMWVKAHC